MEEPLAMLQTREVEDAATTVQVGVAPEHVPWQENETTLFPINWPSKFCPSITTVVPVQPRAFTPFWVHPRTPDTLGAANGIG